MGSKTYIGGYTLAHPPPAGHPDVGMFVQALFEEAMAERERLRLPERWKRSYALRAGHHYEDTSIGLPARAKKKLALNITFSFIERTVANLNSRTPIAEVKPMRGGNLVMTDYNEETEKVEFKEVETMDVDLDNWRNGVTSNFNQLIKSWWGDTEQDELTLQTCYKMETYGVTIEKHAFDRKRGEPTTIVVDPFSFFPAPGNWKQLDKAPYIIHGYPMEVSAARETFENDKIQADDKYDILGRERELYRPLVNSTAPGALNYYPQGFTFNTSGQGATEPINCFVAECWIKDRVNTWTDEDGEQRPYPGGIRVIQICNDGGLVLTDMPNPNVQRQAPDHLQANTWGYDHYPFTIGESYHDDASIWGMSAPEQIYDIQIKIDELITRIIQYVYLQIWPILILPKDCNIPDAHLTNRPGVILQPPIGSMSSFIRFLQPANPPETVWRLFSTLLDMFGRIYAIEDIDRGDAPGNIVAASAISALQERNAVLMRHKIRAVHKMVRSRGRWAISGYQNFGIHPTEIDIDGSAREFRGIEAIGQKYNYVVESGGSYARTTAQEQELAMQMFAAGLADQKFVIETLNVPGKKELLERMGENQLDQAFNILVQAGYPPDGMMEDGTQLPPLEVLQQILSAPQHGPPNNGGANNMPKLSGPGGPTAAPVPRPPLSEQNAEGQGNAPL